LRNQVLIQESVTMILADRMNQEVDWVREEHILKIVITRNALQGEQALVPFYYGKHASYLMDKYPDYFVLQTKVA
jgi:hypothetical protein